jgi:hypothetical protein
MQRKHHRQSLAHGAQGLDEARERRGGVDATRPVKGRNEVISVRNAEAHRGADAFCTLEVARERVDHDVADERDPACGPLVVQVAQPGRLGDEVQVGDLVGLAPVELLGHTVVEAAKSRLDVCDLHCVAPGHRGAGDGRVDVADHQDDVRASLEQQRLERALDALDLLEARCRAHPEVDVGSRNPQLLEEDLREIGVEVLTGVHQDTAHPRCRLHPPHQWRDLREVGARPDDVEDAELVTHGKAFLDEPGPRR